FVRLYEEGRVTREERVVSTCPRCQTVVGPADIEPGDMPADCLRLDLVLDRDPGAIAVTCTAPELLLGAVAIAVPDGHPAAGANAILPMVGRAVPVVAERGTEQPHAIVPAHDPADLAVA